MRYVMLFIMALCVSYSSLSQNISDPLSKITNAEQRALADRLIRDYDNFIRSQVVDSVSPIERVYAKYFAESLERIGSMSDIETLFGMPLAEQWRRYVDSIGQTPQIMIEICAAIATNSKGENALMFERFACSTETAGDFATPSTISSIVKTSENIN